MRDRLREHEPPVLPIETSEEALDTQGAWRLDGRTHDLPGVRPGGTSAVEEPARDRNRQGKRELLQLQGIREKAGDCKSRDRHALRVTCRYAVPNGSSRTGPCSASRLAAPVLARAFTIRWSLEPASVRCDNRIAGRLLSPGCLNKSDGRSGSGARQECEGFCYR